MRRGALSIRSARVVVLCVVGALAAVLVVGRLANDDAATTPFVAPDVGPLHVHGLGIDPVDGSLFLATHTGLFELQGDEQRAARIGDRYQDTMAFTVVGPDRFLGSGHPDLNEALEKNLPPLLGLVQSTDRGATWESISLSGEADFHLLRVVGKRIYGYDASRDRLLLSRDRGRRWRELPKPGPLVDLAVSPDPPRRLAATTENGLFESGDNGNTWRRVGNAVGLLAWPGPLYLIDGTGTVFVALDGGSRPTRRGDIGGQPEALLAEGSDELYVALHDGTIKRSTDGGSTWSVRSMP